MTAMPESTYFATLAYLPDGWRRNVRFDVDQNGNLARVAPDSDGEGAVPLSGPVIPGMPNLHSHAFQRAMAGLAEQAGPSDDSFWTWRDVMYRFLERLTPEGVEAIAAQLYVEMLKAGYTAVGEFHYLHHSADGSPYDDLAEMARRIMAACERSGIGVTLLPVLYGFSGFGGQAPNPGQRRFINDPERYLRLYDAIADDVEDNPQLGLGVAPHSLRAVTHESLMTVLEALEKGRKPDAIHIHIAEQQKEVQDCIAWSGLRPVEWLFETFPVDPEWCLVHATHITDQESGRLAQSGAVAGLCPTTEANLGDGIFPAVTFLEQDGVFGIGSDSHISVSPIEELRWLEYGQRLTMKRRNLLAHQSHGSVGRALFDGALAGGTKALGRSIGRLEVGCRADLVVLNADCPTLIGASVDTLLDALVFSGNENPVQDVLVGGRWVVRDARHEDEDAILANYRAVLDTLSG